MVKILEWDEIGVWGIAVTETSLQSMSSSCRILRNVQ